MEEAAIDSGTSRWDEPCGAGHVCREDTVPVGSPGRVGECGGMKVAHTKPRGDARVLLPQVLRCPKGLRV